MLLLCSKLPMDFHFIQDMSQCLLIIHFLLKLHGAPCCSLIIRGMVPPPGLCKWEAPGICMVCFLSSSRSLRKISFPVRLLANELKLVLPPPLLCFIFLLSIYLHTMHFTYFYRSCLFHQDVSSTRQGFLAVFFIVVSFAARKVLGTQYKIFVEWIIEKNV